MKQAFLLFTAILTLAGTAWFNISGKTTQVTFYADAFANSQAGQSLSASLHSNDDTAQLVACEVTAQPGLVTCDVPARYAGQEFYLQFKQGAVFYIYTVNAPAQ